MIKRYFCFVLALTLLLAGNILPAHASGSEETVTYFADGSYLVTTLTEIPSRASGQKTASKSDRYYDADGSLDWLITVTGTFTYNGTTSQCTYVDGTTSIVATNIYSLYSESPERSGGTATYTVVFSKHVLGIPFSKETYSVSLTCDKDGNLS